MSAEPQTALGITDPHNVEETFVTSVVQVALISGSVVAVTLGVRRHLRADYASEPKEVVCITSRLVLTLDAARNLVDAVGSTLSRAETERAPIQSPSTRQSAH
jgi:hypothetical protein